MVPNNTNHAPSFDRLDERTKGHERDIAKLQEQLSQVNNKLDDIIKTLSEAKGGWRTLLIIGGAAGTLGALIAKLFAWGVTPQ